MKSKFLKLVSLILVVSVLLSGCNFLGGLVGSGLVSYSQMEYVRPNMLQFDAILERSCTTALQTESIELLEYAILEFYDAYDDFYTNYYLALIAYSRDLTDIYWQEEYAYCSSKTAAADAGLDQLYRHLSQSPLRDVLEGDAYFGAGFLERFEGESIYNEHLMTLLTQEAELCARYQTLSGLASDTTYYSEEYFSKYGTQMAEVYLQLVQLRQQMADYLGYDSYPQLAYDFYYVRDYSPNEAMSYLADIRAELVPLYSSLNMEQPSASSEEETFQYVRSMAKKMGGVFWDAFSDMEKAKVYDLAISPNKYGISFEIYLSTYATPYIFLAPTGTTYDRLSFAHEFGHFCTDYVMPGGSMQGVDVAEVFSQGMEYLSLLYAEGGAEMTRQKMSDALCVYVEQAAYASFEHQVYDLTGDELTVEAIQSLYEQVCMAYGLDVDGWDSRDYVCVPHFYETPLYTISYVLSNDAALQIYELELQEQGKGLSCLEKNLTSTQSYILAFLKEAGLENPFATGRLARVRQTLEASFN